jgi:hypothetical protein
MEIMQRAGFVDVEFAGRTGVATSKFTEGAVFRARKGAKAP